MTNKQIKPFIAWAGGKRQLLPELHKHIPVNYNKYYEPFIGGGALLLDLQPDKAVINDYNTELYYAWLAMRDDSLSLSKLVPEGFFDTSDYLQKHVDILNGSYLDALKNVQKDDFVYLDPPYVPLTETASFTTYTNSEFGYNQQVELRDKAIELHKKGAYVMLSNSDTPIVRDLYNDSSIFKIESVQAKRYINSDATKRGSVGEVIITTY